MRSEVLGLLAALRAGQLVRAAPKKEGGLKTRGNEALESVEELSPEEQKEVQIAPRRRVEADRHVPRRRAPVRLDASSCDARARCRTPAGRRTRSPRIQAAFAGTSGPARSCSRAQPSGRPIGSPSIASRTSSSPTACATSRSRKASRRTSSAISSPSSCATSSAAPARKTTRSRRSGIAASSTWPTSPSRPSPRATAAAMATRSCAAASISRASSPRSAQLDRDWHDASLEGRAMRLNLSTQLRESGEAAAALALDPLQRATMGAQLNITDDRWLERFVDAFADGYVDARVQGRRRAPRRRPSRMDGRRALAPRSPRDLRGLPRPRARRWPCACPTRRAGSSTPSRRSCCPPRRSRRSSRRSSKKAATHELAKEVDPAVVSGIERRSSPLGDASMLELACGCYGTYALGAVAQRPHGVHHAVGARERSAHRRRARDRARRARRHAREPAREARRPRRPTQRARRQHGTARTSRCASSRSRRCRAIARTRSASRSARCSTIRRRARGRRAGARRRAWAASLPDPRSCCRSRRRPSTRSPPTSGGCGSAA